MAKNGTGHKNVIFVGLMLGMLVTAVSQTIVSPAMPVIVSELGGIEHYSWIATSALLASAMTVPVIGKLSDIYGRRGFYIAGIVVFMLGSVLAGAAQDFWWLVAARAVQGFGMGTIMPLSQTIIGDIISARERGRYMGYIGAVFGVASIAGPLVGGWITDNISWRWLFYVNLPIGVAALGFIVAYLHVPHTPRRHRLDYIGFAALPLALVAVLLATTWGGTTYPWASWQIISLFVVGALVLIGFLINEYYAEEPVLPLRLWKNSVFSLSNISNMAIAMTMFGAIFFIPVYAQGVIGVERYQLRRCPHPPDCVHDRREHRGGKAHHPHGALQGVHARRTPCHGGWLLPAHTAGVRLDADRSHVGHDRRRPGARGCTADLHARGAERHLARGSRRCHLHHTALAFSGSNVGNGSIRHHYDQ